MAKTMPVADRLKCARSGQSEKSSGSDCNGESRRAWRNLRQAGGPAPHEVAPTRGMEFRIAEGTSARGVQESKHVPGRPEARRRASLGAEGQAIPVRTEVEAERKDQLGNRYR